MRFSDGNKKGKGRPKGAKNRTSLGQIDWDETDRIKIKKGIMALVIKGNPTILAKFLDYYLRVENPDLFRDSHIEIPNVDELSDQQVLEYLEKIKSRT